MSSTRPAFKEVASGLRFPEGPVAMPDGSVVVVEIERRTLSRVMPGGKIRVIATLDGGPNAPPWARTARSTSPTTAA